MTDSKKSLRRTLNYVANTTRARDRLTEIKRTSAVPSRRRPPGWAIGLASFATVILVAVIPILMTNPSSEQEVQSSPPAGVAAPTSSTTVAPSEGVPSIDPTGESSEQSLGVDRAWCLYSNSGTPGVSGHVTEFVAGEPVDEGVYASWCESYDEAGVETDFTVCRGVYPVEFYEEVFSGDHRLIAGDLEQDRPGFPVVLAWNADCENEDLTTSPPIALDSAVSYERFDQIREIELDLRSRIDDQCLSESAALDIAVDTWTRLGEGWVIVREEVGSPVECYGIAIDLLFGAVLMMPSE